MNKMRKNLLIILLTITLIALIIEATVLFKAYPVYPKSTVVFNFENDELLSKTIEVNTQEYMPDIDKLSVMVDDKLMNELIKVDTSKLDLTKIGTYEVEYYIIYHEKKYSEFQTIIVVDTEKPVITLKGKDITMLVGETYKEPGYTVTDNYDKDLQDKVIIDSNINNKTAGSYKVTYKVSDSSGNSAEVTRNITIKKPYVVKTEPPKEVKVTTPKVVETSYSNVIKKNKFTSNKVILEGYLKEPLENNKIILKGNENKELAITINNNNYTLNIDPESIPNGTYKMYINEEPLVNKIGSQERLSRAKVGSKLVSFTYNTKDEVTISIEDHSYKYDIIINPGHGGEDTGAVNEYIQEKEMNLKVSMYEKCRYESHGLRVYMTRVGDYYGNNYGPSDLIKLHKVAYEMGYYGAVSKIVYSNHHNSIGNNYYNGYEVLIAASLTGNELLTEKSIANKWNSMYPSMDNHLRFYARDYDTEKKYSKLNGETYNFKDNYAVNRIPLATANVKSIIYEGCYMSNKEEFNWYWLNNNWYKISEAKIEAYVKSLGLTYNSDNSSCL